MNRSLQEEQQKQIFYEIADDLMNGKITPKQACSFIEKVRDTDMFPDNMETEDNTQQKGFNEIAGIYADWKITTEEACESFNEWIVEWKTNHVKN